MVLARISIVWLSSSSRYAPAACSDESAATRKLTRARTGLTEEELLTVDEAATRLEVHPETIRRWIRSGAMRGNLIGGDRAGYRVPASEVELRLRGLRPSQLPGMGKLVALSESR